MRIAPFFVCLFLSLAQTALAQTKLAFVAGVERYNKSGLKNLEYAEDDAHKVKAALEALDFKTFEVIGENATLSQLNTELDRFVAATKKLNKTDIAIVYFSGHGAQKLVQRPTADGGTVEVEEPFFCPNDAIKADVSTLLSLNTLLRRLSDFSGSDRNIIILDACRDSADKSGKTGGIDGNKIELSDKLALFFAAKSGQRSYESKQLGHGIFTHYLLEGLNGAAADSFDEITFQGLADYVSKQVERNSPRLLQVETVDAQTPNLMANLSGTIVLGKVTPKVPPPPPSRPMAARVKNDSRERFDIDSPTKSNEANPPQKLSYEQALVGVLHALDVNGDGVSISSKLIDPSDLDEIAGQLISGNGAATFISGMPRDFSRRRVDQMSQSNLVIPYINHEGIAYRPYSLQTKSAAKQLDDAASRAGLEVIGITPLDHSRALYAVAVTKADGNLSWLLFRVTEQYVRMAQNGNGPEPSRVHSAAAKALGMLQE